MNPVMGSPPLAGTVHVTRAVPLPGVTGPTTGVPGTVAVGVTGAVGDDGAPVPEPLTASTVKV